MSGYKLGLYEKAMPSGLSFSQMLKTAKESGFDYMEISIDETDERLKRLKYTDAELESIVNEMYKQSFFIRTMCLSGHRKFPLGSHDENVRARSLEIMRDAVDFADKLGIRIIQLAGYDVYYEEHDEETQRYFNNNLKLAVDFAAEKGVLLGFETMETPFMDTTEKAMEYVHMINSPYLGVYPDIGNIKNAAVKYGLDVTKDLEAGGAHIFAAHLKETKPDVYRNMTFGEGHTEYEKPIAKLYESGVRMFTGEFWHLGGEAEDYLQKANSFLRERIEKAIRPS